MMNFLIRHRGKLLAGLIGVTLLMVYGLTSLRIDFSFDSFFPRNEPEYLYYQSFQEQFTEEQNYLILVALKGPGENVFEKDFLTEADQVFQELAELEGVDSSVYMSTVPYIRFTGTGMSSKPYLDFSTEETLSKSQKLILKDSSLIGSFITRDLEYVCGYFFIAPEIFDTPGRDKLSNAIDEVLAEVPFEQVVSGIPYIRTQYVKKIGNELIFFTGFSIFLIVGVLFFLYRSTWGVLIPLAATLVSLLWLLGSMGLNGQSINLLSNLLIPVMFVVSMSDVIHLITKFLHELPRQDDPRKAMEVTLKEIGLAVFLTSVTTAIGFASLIVSRVPPIRTFGIYAAAGVIFTYLISIIIIPNALLVLKKAKLMRHKALEGHPIWDVWMDKVYAFTHSRSRGILVAFGIAILVSVFYIPRISTDIYLLEDIGPNDPIRISMEFFEKQSYGLRSFEIGLHAKGDKLVTDPAILMEIEKIQDHLLTKRQFSPFLSVSTFLKEANYITHYRRPQYKRLPDSEAEVDEILNTTGFTAGESILRNFYSEDEKVARISSRLPDIGTEALDSIYQDLDQFIIAECDTSLFSYRYTGQAYLTEVNLDYLRTSLLLGLLVAFVVIGILMGILFKSWKMLWMSMIPNLIPLIFTGGIMGIFGIPLTASTTIVFVIAFGIAVDDTIHFLTRYRFERNRGLGVDEAIRKTIQGTGKAMILTSLVLISGFCLLITSDFGGTFSTGLFTGLTVLFAILSDLFLLPVLLQKMDREEEKISL
ncbi:MAG: efflux RND transporter permease subunit [Bacteroidota bacterium]